MLILSHYLQGFREMDNFPSETGEKAMLKNVRHSHAKVRFLHFSLRWCKRAQKKNIDFVTLFTRFSWILIFALKNGSGRRPTA